MKERVEQERKAGRANEPDPARDLAERVSLRALARITAAVMPGGEEREKEKRALRSPTLLRQTLSDARRSFYDG